MKSIKKTTSSITLLMIFLFAGTLTAQEFQYTDSWGNQGFELTQQKSSSVEVNYSIRSFTLGKDQIDGEQMDILQLPGTFLPNDEGMPNLPGQGRYIAVPQGAAASVEITASRTETFENIEMAPAPRIPWETEDGPLDYLKDQAVYGKDAFYPEQPVKISNAKHIRGVDAVILGITPFQYNPVTKELIVYRDLKVKVSFSGGNGHFGEDRLRSRWWDPMLSDILLNYESLPKIDYNKSFQGTKDVGCEYLIISPTNPEFLQWADSIKEFRTMQGIQTDVVPISDIGANNANTIETYINNAYNTWDIVPAAILLFGDYGTNAANSVIAPIYNNYCVSDNIYGDVDGDQMPDIITARMTANNATELQTMVTKFINYERNPPDDPGFYDHPMTCLGYQTERWFQICTESVAGYWENELGKTTTRENAIYNGNPQSGTWSTATNTSTVLNYFGPNGLGYIPASPGSISCTWNATGNSVANTINNGAFMLLHRDHGAETLWGEPGFSNSNVNSLTNTDLTYIWSVNCLTGKYNYSGECLVEKLHRHTSGGNNAGALGAIGDSEVSYSFVNDTYVWGSFDYMWPDFMPDYGTVPEQRGIMPSFANAAGKYFLQSSNWPYNTSNKEVTYNLFHHHGDGFLMVYSELPQNLTVTHNPILYAGVTSFDVTADDGAFIALTVNGEIIGTAEATGAPVSITIPPQQPPDHMIVTITKQNYLRYHADVEVIPPAGPYIVQNAVQINDDGGNGNGIMETSESIMASITVENVGVENANNVSVTISTTDPFVEITDDTENYGTITAGSLATVTDGFAWDVTDSIPNMHMVVFELNATDGTDTWTTYFSVQGHGPELVIGDLTIDDSEGNGNGRLDPGEDVTLIIETSNEGSYHAMGAIGSLTISSPYITVNNATYDFTFIASGQSENAEFSITVSAGAPVGTPVNILYDVTSGGYNVQETYGATIGLIVEDWETGGMNQYEWQTGGNANWAVTSQNPYEGTYCIKSGSISNSQSTWLSLDYDVASGDVISFMYKVSSESGYDYLSFYIDNNLQDSWSGEAGWAQGEYDVTEGTHNFKWEYSKDFSVNGGSDCAWLDFIVLPAIPTTTAYAGQDDEICGGMTYQTQGGATLYLATLWTTSGSGSFDDPQSFDAVYTPSDQDILDGSVTLTLTAYYSGGVQVSDDMILTIQAAPTAFAGDDNTVSQGNSYTLSDATAGNYAEILWETSGDGTFDDNTIVNPTYTPGPNDIVNEEVNLNITAFGIEPCGEETDDMTLTIDVGIGVSEATSNRIAVFPNPNTGLFTIILKGSSQANVSLSIYNALGDVVYEKRGINIKGNHSEDIDLNVEPGIYYVRAEGNDLLINKKIIIRK